MHLVGWIGLQHCPSLPADHAAAPGNPKIPDGVKLRLDHILYAGRQITPAHYCTLANEQTRTAADHLPVCLDTA